MDVASPRGERLSKRNLSGYRIMQVDELEHRGSSFKPGVRVGDPRSGHGHVIPRFDRST